MFKNGFKNWILNRYERICWLLYLDTDIKRKSFLLILVASHRDRTWLCDGHHRKRRQPWQQEGLQPPRSDFGSTVYRIIVYVAYNSRFLALSTIKHAWQKTIMQLLDIFWLTMLFVHITIVESGHGF